MCTPLLYHAIARHPDKDLSTGKPRPSVGAERDTNRHAWLLPVKRMILLPFLLANTVPDIVMAEKNAAAVQIRIHGIVTDGGIVCPLLTTENGDRFPLMGIRKNEYPSGTWLDLTGRFFRFSACQQGERAFSVEKVESANDSGKRER